MNIIHHEAIKKALSKDAVIQAVRDAFIAYSEGRIESPSPMHMTYSNEEGDRIGDCHVKAAHSNAHPVIAIKLAVGFYENAAKGLPVNNGLVMLLSRETGEPTTLLLDEGWLTTYRTAAAGALAASLAEIGTEDVLGIVGTGSQAFEQADWTAHHLGLKNVLVFGRSAEKAEALAETLCSRGLHASRAGSAADLCAASRVVITTTPASDPVVRFADLPEPMRPIHFVAMGSDTYGKQELDVEILRSARTIVVDDKEQCLDHGEAAAASAAQAIDPDQLVSLGSALASGLKIRGGVSVVDLTGLGAQDLAIASLVA